MQFSFAHLCVAWLICGYCTVLASWQCRDFSNFDVCEDSDVDDLHMSFGKCDVRITPRMAEREPVIKYERANTDSKYILVMVDPDAPSRRTQSKKWWRHWILADIPGWSLQSHSSKTLPGTSLTEVTYPASPQLKLVLDLATPEGCKAELTWMVGREHQYLQATGHPASAVLKIENLGSGSDYQGPAPPHGTGPHRYQLLLFEQEDGDVETVIPMAGDRGSWDLNMFVRANDLCYNLVAATQFRAAHQS